MAAPTIDPILTNVTLANDLTDWAGFNDGGGGAGSDILEEDIFIQGTAAVSKKISGSSRNEGLVYTPGAGAADISADADAHVFFWIAFTTKGFLETIANGGVYIRLGDGTNWSKWFVDGSDLLEATIQFKRYVIDTRKSPSEDSGTPCDLTAVTEWGAGVKTTSTAGTSKSENLIVDRIDYGTGLRIEDGEAGDECNWAAMFADDTLIDNKYGIIESRAGVFYVKGAIEIGDTVSKTTLWLEESGATVVFEAPKYHNGTALVSAVGSDLYTITIQGNGTGTTDVTFGQVIGSGDDRQGLNGGTLSAVRPVHYTIDAETDIADLDTVNFYGTTFTRAGETLFSGATKTDLLGCQFNNCDDVHPHDAEFLNNTIVAPSPDRGIEMISTHNIKQIGFIAGEDTTFAADRVWAVDVSATPDLYREKTEQFNGENLPGPPSVFVTGQAVGDWTAFGCVSKFGRLTVDMSTLGTGSPAVAWEYWDGSTWSALTGVTDGTSAFTADGDVTYDIPNDWTAVSLNDEWPQFYIRARITTDFTVAPTFNVTSTTTSAIDDVVEHHVWVPAAGALAAYTFDALEFFGFSPDGAPKWMVENSEAIQSIDDNINLDTQDTDIDLDGTVTGAGQSITGDGNPLDAVGFLLRKVGAPTGDMVANIYAHSGVFGTSSVPTGAPLATSDVISAADIQLTTLERWVFVFQTPFTPLVATNYVVTIEYAGVDASNRIEVGEDSSTPSHGGNKSTENVTWSADSAADVIFLAGTNGVLIIDATNGANPTNAEVESTAVDDTVPAPDEFVGASAVNNPVTFTISGLVAGSEVRIFTDPAGVELAGVESSGTSFAYAYTYTGDIDIYVIIQHIDYDWRRVNDTLISTDQTIPANQVPDADRIPA